MMKKRSRNSQSRLPPHSRQRRMQAHYQVRTQRTRRAKKARKRRMQKTSWLMKTSLGARELQHHVKAHKLWSQMTKQIKNTGAAQMDSQQAADRVEAAGKAKATHRIQLRSCRNSWMWSEQATQMANKPKQKLAAEVAAGSMRCTPIILLKSLQTTNGNTEPKQHMVSTSTKSLAHSTIKDAMVAYTVSSLIISE
jgi:hypothetical protein